jgi:hypothetical protein
VKLNTDKERERKYTGGWMRGGGGGNKRLSWVENGRKMREGPNRNITGLFSKEVVKIVIQKEKDHSKNKGLLYPYI